MKRTALLLSLLFLIITAELPAATNAALEKFAQEFLPICPGTTLTQAPWDQPLPKGMQATMVTLENDHSRHCGGRYLAITTSSGRVFLGFPWMLQGLSGSPADRIRAFAWDHLQESITVEIPGRHTDAGTQEVITTEVTEFGRLAVRGSIDPTGSFFFPGHFYSLSGGAAGERMNHLEPVLAEAPVQGKPGAAVRIVEFSDFQCPSCKRSSSLLKPILEKYGDRIEYRRIDLPLFRHHSWALPAALYGRAIYHQSPEAFWNYKDRLFDHQGELNNFVLEDFTQGFAEGEGLDVERLMRESASEALKREILDGLGTAIALQVEATPTFWINGRPIDPGEDGTQLSQAIRSALGE